MLQENKGRNKGSVIYQRIIIEETENAFLKG